MAHVYTHHLKTASGDLLEDPFYVGLSGDPTERLYPDYQLTSSRSSNFKQRSGVWFKTIEEHIALSGHHEYIPEKWYKSFIEKYVGVRLKDDLTTQQAYELEHQLIKKYGKLIDNTGILANISDGGYDRTYAQIRDAKNYLMS